MATLRKGELVLNLEEGQLLEGYGFVYVGVNVYNHDIVLTPTNKAETIMVEDVLHGDHEERPHAITVTEEGYVIEVNGLTQYIEETDKYTAIKGKTALQGVVVPAHLVLSLPVPEDEDDYNGLDNEPETMEELEEALSEMSLDELREYAQRLGIELIASDWRKTIISKIKTWWKREWKRTAC